jgi:hypothetical protein
MICGLEYHNFTRGNSTVRNRTEISVTEISLNSSRVAVLHGTYCCGGRFKNNRVSIEYIM